MFLQRKLRAKFVGLPEYLPKGMPEEKFIPVVGFSSQWLLKHYDGKERREEELTLIMIGDNQKLVSCAAFNCKVILDEKEAETIQVLERATILLKVLAERTGDEKKDS
jgi:hypothetical protein